MVRVAFIHPDLGIGGAERLIVDAALALKSRGHAVHLFTSHHDPGHSFSETRDGTLQVTCVADWLPRHCCGVAYAFWAYLRMIVVALYLVFFSGERFQVVVCDQISACIPVLRLGGARVVFYCHFPDQLLTHRQHWLKRLYRYPLDRLEEWSTGLAHLVLVNSEFTKRVFRDTFSSLSHIRPSVLYPSLHFSAFDKHISVQLDSMLPQSASQFFLSVNRYERKKGLPLAIKAFSVTLSQLSPQESRGLHLVMAGGYDERVVENREHYLELRALAKEMGVANQVTFLRSLSQEEKLALLAGCLALLYTPANEHFGICPLEAMYMQRPVVAVASGGPLETVVHEATGFLCDPAPDAFARHMLYLLRNPGAAEAMGAAGRTRVASTFSFNTFTERLDTIVSSE